MKPRIYDCFPFFNENMLLALRLELMYEHVDHFVIVESTHTFTGQPKQMYFTWEGLERYRDKIIHLIVDDMPIHLGDPVKNETHQRNAVLRGLKDARPNDLVLISDLDEIPDPKAIGRYDPRHVCGVLVQPLYCYFLNNLSISGKTGQPDRWIKGKITTMRHLVNFYREPEFFRHLRPNGLLDMLRRLWHRIDAQPIERGGWHFSWVMTPERMIQKIAAFSHTEYDSDDFKNVDSIKAALRDGKDISGREIHYRIVPLDDSFPPNLLASREKYAQWIVEPAAK